MRRLPVSAALVVVALAITGAILHPFSLILKLLPIDDRGAVSALIAARTLIADLLGWALLSLLIVMVVYIVRSRRHHSLSESIVAAGGPDSRVAEARPLHLPRVVVAITAYNDAAATAHAVRDFYRQPSVIKVIVVDNNSTDQTAELAAAAGATVVRETRQGYGFACMRGLAEGLNCNEADVVLLTEGDGTFVAEDTFKFLAYIDHTDLVVGNRTVRGLVEPDSQMDHFFTWGNMAVAMLLRLRSWDGRFLGPAGLTDVGCTFRAIRRDALARILPDLTVGGNHFSPHMLLVAVAHGLTVVEIPIRFRRRIGKSKGASRSFGAGLRVGLAMIWHILAFNLQPRSKPRVVVDRDEIIVRSASDSGRSQPTIEFVAGATDALATLSRSGHSVVVIADRRDDARLGISPALTRAIDRRIATEVEHHGGHIEAFVKCQHGPKQNCACRQARPALLLRAASHGPASFDRMVVVSNRPSFLQSAAMLGCSTILVGRKISDSPSLSKSAMIAPHLRAAAELVLNPRATNGGKQVIAAS